MSQGPVWRTHSRALPPPATFLIVCTLRAEGTGPDVPAASRKAAGLAAVAVLLMAGCGQSTTTLDSKQVRLEAESIGSIATEGRIVAEQHLRGELKESFVQVHAADLAAQAASDEQDLEPSRAPPALAHDVERLQSLAEETSVRLRALETRPRDHEAVQGAVESLARLAEEATKIEDSL